VVWVLEIAPNLSWLSKSIIMAIKKMNTQLINSNYLVFIYNRGSQSFLTKSNIRLNPPGLHRFFKVFDIRRADSSSNLIFFQILRPDSSLILNFFKYLEPEGIIKSNTRPTPCNNLVAMVR
jgi:hypothetical protein